MSGTGEAPTEDTRPIELGDLFKRLEQSLPRLLGPRIDLVIENQDLQAQLNCDLGRVEQLLSSLAQRAHEAMHTGGRFHIAASTLRLDEDNPRQLKAGHYTALTVTDTSRGLDEDLVRRLMEPYATASQPAPDLQLALHMSALRRQGSGVFVESSPGLGTSFIICLPQLVDSATPSTRGAHRNGESILVVEDEPILRRLVTTVLERRGYQVMEATNGEEALELLDSRAGGLDLLLTDIVMPGMGGPELGLLLRERFPGMHTLYISGYTPDTLTSSGLHPTGRTFLRKPFTVNELLDRVKELLKAPAPTKVV